MSVDEWVQQDSQMIVSVFWEYEISVQCISSYSWKDSKTGNEYSDFTLKFIAGMEKLIRQRGLEQFKRDLASGLHCPSSYISFKPWGDGTMLVTVRH